MNMVPVSGNWHSLAIAVVGANVRRWLVEWVPTIPERPERIELEAYAVVAWVVREEGRTRTNATIFNVAPVHEDARALLADVRESPTGRIRLKGYGMFTSRASLVKSLLAELQKRWDDAHPVVEADAQTA